MKYTSSIGESWWNDTPKKEREYTLLGIIIFILFSPFLLWALIIKFIEQIRKSNNETNKR
jgi:hypothetical protein